MIINFYDLDTLKILESIHNFYDSAWDKLVIFGTLLVAIVGILIPIVVLYAQRLMYKVEENKMKNELQIKMTEVKNTLENSVEEKFKNLSETLNKKIDDVEKSSKGSVCLMQGNFYLSNRSYSTATLSYIASVNNFLETTDQRNLQTALEMLTATFSYLYEKDIEDSEIIVEKFDAVIKKLHQKDTEGQYSKYIEKLSKSMKEARNRKPKPVKKN